MSGMVEALAKEAAHQKQLDDLARLRLSLREARDERKAAMQHREESGRFASHPDVRSHDQLARHMAGPGHSMAILSEWRGSTKNMALAHASAHAILPTDHGIDEVGE